MPDTVFELPRASLDLECLARIEPGALPELVGKYLVLWDERV